jgi:hypothetical protein
MASPTLGRESCIPTGARDKISFKIEPIFYCEKIRQNTGFDLARELRPSDRLIVMSQDKGAKDPEDFFDLTGERLGKGAYGVVIKARDKKDNSIVAMKIMDIEKVTKKHGNITLLRLMVFLLG